MSIILDGKTLTIEKEHRISRGFEKISLYKDSVHKINQCRKMVEDKIDKKEIVYGINTGIGEFSETVLDDSQIEDFQKYLYAMP